MADAVSLDPAALAARLDAAAQALGAALQARGWRLASAESCTGGMIGAALTAIAGSSDWFERGYITYSNAAKQQDLGVDAALLAAHGAVSEPVALAMAAGARARAGADLALSVTGIAGPGGGTADKPVGTVCFGWASATQVRAQQLHFAGDREAVRLQSAAHALRTALALLG